MRHSAYDLPPDEEIEPTSTPPGTDYAEQLEILRELRALQNAGPRRARPAGTPVPVLQSLILRAAEDASGESVVGPPDLARAVEVPPLQAHNRTLVEVATHHGDPAGAVPVIHLAHRGENGSGKSHLLEAMSNGALTLDGIPVTQPGLPVPGVKLFPLASSPPSIGV
jgi:hypothetical protein